MGAFREKDEEATVYQTSDGVDYRTNEPKNVRSWRHATKDEWDYSSEGRREILMLETGIAFVVSA